MRTGLILMESSTGFNKALYLMNCLSSYGDSFNNSLQRQVGDYSFVPDMRKECTKKDVEEYLKIKHA